MMMIPRRRNEFDLFNDFFGGDDFFTRRESAIMKTDIKEKKDKYLLDIALHSMCQPGNQTHRGLSRSICLFSHFGENFHKAKSVICLLLSF